MGTTWTREETMEDRVNTTDLETISTEYSMLWHLPVTPADLDAAGIELDAPFGVDADEQTELAHEPGLARLSFGIYCDAASDPVCRPAICVEAFEVRLPDTDPGWHSCYRRYADVSGAKVRTAYARNEARMWTLAQGRVDDLDAALDAALAAYQAAYGRVEA